MRAETNPTIVRLKVSKLLQAVLRVENVDTFAHTIVACLAKSLLATRAYADVFHS